LASEKQRKDNPKWEIAIDKIGKIQQILQSFHDLKANTKDMKEIQGWNDAIQSLEKNGLTSVSFSSILLQMGRGIIGGFVLSYLLAFVLNRKN
jgi:hypothetical protein